MQHLKELDIDSLNEYARFLLDILTIDPTESSNNLHVNEYRNSFGEIIAHAYSKKCRTDLNSIIRELETPLKYLGSQFVSNVNIELKKRFGIEIPKKKIFKKQIRSLIVDISKQKQSIGFCLSILK